VVARAQGSSLRPLEQHGACALQTGSRPGLQADPELARLVGEAPEAYAAAGDAARAADATPRAPPPPSRDLLSASPYEEELSEAEELVRTSQRTAYETTGRSRHARLAAGAVWAWSC
jgi:hypothetical protein